MLQALCQKAKWNSPVKPCPCLDPESTECQAKVKTQKGSICDMWEGTIKISDLPSSLLVQ